MVVKIQNWKIIANLPSTNWYAKTLAQKINLVKYNLSYYIPKLIDFIGEEKFPWNDLERKFDNKINQRVSETNGNTIVIEASIFDQIISLKKGDSNCIGMMDFL